MGYQAPIFGANAFLPSSADADLQTSATAPGIVFAAVWTSTACEQVGQTGHSSHFRPDDRDIFLFP
jgi:hypothetical protein